MFTSVRAWTGRLCEIDLRTVPFITTRETTCRMGGNSLSSFLAISTDKVRHCVGPDKHRGFLSSSLLWYHQGKHFVPGNQMPENRDQINRIDG